MQKGSHLSLEARGEISIANKGRRYSPKTEFKKGQPPWNKGLRGVIVAWNKGRRPPPDEVERLRVLSRNRLGRKNSPEHRRKISLSTLGRPSNTTDESRQKCSESLRKRLADDGNLREQRIRQVTELNRSAKRRAEVSQQAKTQWSNIDFRNRVAKSLAQAMQRKPNKPEIKLEGILDRNYPGIWDYVGDGRLIIGGYNPDYTNINGQKAVIELFGDYWHGKRARRWSETELGRIMAYNALGFRCLVIWEHELQNERAVVAKVKQFEKEVLNGRVSSLEMP